MERGQYRFFVHGKNKLVMPGVASGGPPHKDNERKPGGGSGDGGGGVDDPLIAAVIQKLPKAGPWSADDRMNWLKLLTMAFQATYGQEDPIEIKKEAAN